MNEVRTYSSTTLHGLGLVFHVPGVMALGSLLISLLTGEWYALIGFLSTAGVTLGLGQFLCRVFTPVNAVNVRAALLIAALGWASVSVVGALPFLLVAWYPDIPYQNAFAVRVLQDPGTACSSQYRASQAPV